jgi:predicted S18 family serine protease
MTPTKPKQRHDTLGKEKTMKKVLIAGAIAAAFTLTGCQSNSAKEPYTQAPEPEKRSALAAIATASAENKAAKKSGFEWRDTGKMLKGAEALVAEGKYAAAQSEAIKAYYQAKTAQSQAKTQVGAGNPSYLYQ